jgi:hypothetical protein
MFGSPGGQQAADGMDGLAPLSDDAGQITARRLHGEDIPSIHRGMCDEDLVRMAGEPAEDETEKFLHGGGVGAQAAAGAAARAFLTMLRTVSDICAPFLTQ